MVQFLLVGKDLAVNGLQEEIVNNNATNTVEDDVSEVQSIKWLRTEMGLPDIL